MSLRTVAVVDATCALEKLIVFVFALYVLINGMISLEPVPSSK